MKLIVGLGNPGTRYELTRHNLGFRVVDRLASQNSIALTEKLCDSLVGKGSCAGEEIVLVKPQSFMNHSGLAVECLLRDYRRSATDLIVIHDDLDLPFGRIRIRPSGGAGGHRGVESILEQVSSAAFLRVRIGIGRPPEGIDPVDYVLEAFTADEAQELNAVVERAGESVLCLVRDGVEQAMGRYNRAP
jgi:peptidyl-tRNA hydrolase, PTH1 family